MSKIEKHVTEENLRLFARILSGLKSQTDNLADKCVLAWSDSKVYAKDDLTFHNGTLWRALSVSSNNEPNFNDTVHWEPLDGTNWNEIGAQEIEAMLSDITAEQLDYLSNILSDQISTTHAWSSSKSYTENQATLQSSKDYTDQQVSKTLSKSYVVVDNINLVTEDKYIYLVKQSDNTYLSYVLGADGNPIAFGDPNSVNLDNYLDITTAENTYAKTSDIQGKYAEITTVDAKVDKTNVLNTVSSTPTTDDIYNAQVMNTELAKKANAFNIHELADDSGKTKHLVIDIPSINSISGKTTRLFFSDNMKDEIGLQVWSADGILESDVRLSSKAIKQGDVAEVNWINCTTESNVSGMEVLIKNDDKTITDCGAFYAYKETTGGISYDINVLAKIGNIHLITPSDKSVYLNSKEICTKAVVDVPWTQLTMGSGMNGSMEYRVKNGICYVRVTSIACSTMSTRGQTITSGLPIPELTANVWYSLAANSSTYGTLLINIDSTGKMTNFEGVDNAPYCGFFSYPVKES